MRCLAWVHLCLLLVCPHLAAASPADVSFERRRWVQADGAPPQAFGMTQASDGMLWLTSPKGLYSFDGVTFKRQSSVYGASPLSQNISAVRALPGKRIAVGYSFGGLSIFSPSAVTHFRAGKDFPAGTVYAIASSNDEIYACTTTGLVQLRPDGWRPVGKHSLPAGPVYAAGFDNEENFWVLTNDEAYARKKGDLEFSFVTKYISPSQLVFYNHRLLLKLPNGQFAAASASGKLAPMKLAQPWRYSRLAAGPKGTLIASRDGGFGHLAPDRNGIWREIAYYPAVYGSSEQAMTDGIGISLLTDREGNLWRTTYDGIEKIRAHRFNLIQRKDSLWLAQPGLADEMWIGGWSQPMSRRKPDGTSAATNVRKVYAILRAAGDHVWVGVENGLWEFKRGSQRFWQLPASLNGKFDVQALALDADGTLLVSIMRNGLWRFERGVWSKDQRLSQVADNTPVSMLRDSAGRTWIGLTNNRLGLLAADAVQLVPESGRLRIGNVLSLADIDGRILAGGEAGLAWVQGDAAHAMQFAGYDAVGRVTGIVLDKKKQLWVHSDEGLLMLPAAELARFWRSPTQPVKAELFDFEDGVIGAAASVRPLPSLSVDAAGRVFYATTSRLGWVDPAQLVQNRTPPEVIIQSLRTQKGEFDAVSGMTLAPRTTAIDFHFTATALSIPERVKLKYRLDGVDDDWQLAQRGRIAQYTNLSPGSYRFRVIAANEDGVWNLAGASVPFRILPAFWETFWFQLGCALSCAGAAYLVYRWRIVGGKRRAAELADERVCVRMSATLSERNRIARSLHDNLLQAVQALILRFQSVQYQMPHEARVQAKLDAVLSYAEELVESTRDEVMELRREMSCEELFDALRKAFLSVTPDAQRVLNCSTRGMVVPLSRIVAHEIFYVLREAVWNSARHARPSHILVTLSFNRDWLEGTVIDDGVGLADSAGNDGVTRHWGIAGMRERISRLGGDLTVKNGPRRGVIVRFSIPCATAPSAAASGNTDGRPATPGAVAHGAG